MSMSSTALQIELPNLQQETAKLAGAVIKAARAVVDYYEGESAEIDRLEETLNRYDIKADPITRLPE